MVSSASYPKVGSIGFCSRHDDDKLPEALRSFAHLKHYIPHLRTRNQYLLYLYFVYDIEVKSANYVHKSASNDHPLELNTDAIVFCLQRKVA
jgi:hypothetical protein